MPDRRRIRSTLPAALLVAAVLAAGCGTGETPDRATNGSTALEREMKGFSLTQTHEGRRSWQLHAETAWRLPNDPDIRLRGVRLDFFDEKGDSTSHLTSRQGRVNEKSGDMSAEGRVTLITAGGDTLQTEEAAYRRDDDRITGPGFVRIAKPDRVLTGTGFTATPDLEDYKIHHDVHVTLIDREHDGAGAP